VNDTLTDGFVNHRHGGREKFIAGSLIMAGDRSTELLDLSPNFTAVSAIYLVTLGVLPNTL